MPFQSDAQVTGDRGELWFETQLPERWLAQRPTHDVGIDRLVVVCEEGEINGHEFRVQIKASTEFPTQNEYILLKGIKRSTIDYWFMSPLLTMIVAYDTTQNCGYYAWHRDLYEQVKHLEQDTEQKTTQIKLTRSNRLIGISWDSIRDDLRRHKIRFRNCVVTAENSMLVLPVIHQLTDAVRNINCMGYQETSIAKRDEKDAGLIALFEISQHHKIKTTVSTLSEKLDPDLEICNYVNRWISAYCSQVRTIFPSFDDYVDPAPLDFPVVFAPKAVDSVRPRLIEAVFNLIWQLSYTPANDGRSSPTDAATPQSDSETSDRISRDASTLLSEIKQTNPKTTTKEMIAKVSVIDLGFPNGATTAELIGNANDVSENGSQAPYSTGRVSNGLKLCSPDVGPLTVLNNPPETTGDKIHVAMKPIAGDDGEPHIFTIENSGGTINLDAARARPDDFWNASDQFLVALDPNFKQHGAK